ncbi:MAG: DUF3299 domain-containing protein [Xanthomonadales bacterium]|jgi:hypothetical protein|nr:DUF3299 domain-containing protein [Xanthomonadales bacterium]
MTRNQSSAGGSRAQVIKLSDQVAIKHQSIKRTFRQRIAIAFLITLFVLFVPTVVSAQDEDPLAHYQILEWKDLVAEGWKRPLLLSEEEVSSPSIDLSSLVPELEKELVALPGFMRPAVKEGAPVLAHDQAHDHEHLSAGTWVKEFVLVPFLPQNPCSHALWDPNQVVYVNLLESVLVDDPESPVWVVGTITLDNIMTDDGLSAYRIVDAVTTTYEY